MSDDAVAETGIDPVHAEDLVRAVVAEAVPHRDQDVAALLVQLTRLSRVVEARLARLAAERGLGPTETAVLLALWAAPQHRATPTLLAELLVQTSGGMTATLRRLTDAGFIRRVADPDDGRSRFAELTPEGAAIGLASLDHMTADLEQATADLTRPEVGQLQAAVSLLLDRLTP